MDLSVLFEGLFKQLCIYARILIYPLTMHFLARTQLVCFFSLANSKYCQINRGKGLHIFIKNRITKLLSCLYENKLKMKIAQRWGLLTLILLNLKVVN